MKKTFTRIIVGLGLLLSANYAFAQDTSEVDESSPFSIGGDIVSRYVWRGLNFSANAPAIQPSISYSSGGFTVGTWGSYTIGEITSQELDIYASYTFLGDMLTIGVTDYYFPSETTLTPYFAYEGNRTGHVLEASFTYNGTDSFPLSLMVATNFYGADKEVVANPDGSTDNNYSTYIELGYGIDVKGVGISMFVGGVANESSYYTTSKAAFTNVGATFSKSVDVSSNYSIGFYSSLVFNPHKDAAYLVFGISL